jgi:DNA polymerase-3 subunit epsilon
MTQQLRDLRVLVLDCQAAGATPAHGDLLELGWSICGDMPTPDAVRAHWIARRTERAVPRAIRELTGWSEASATPAITEQAAWRALCEDAAQLALPPAPTLIHYASFELPFLHDLHARLGPSDPFPFDVRCVHAIAARLFPELPRRNIRALAGYLGHTTELSRRAEGHVLATAFIWRALVSQLEAAGVSSWPELTSWLAVTRRPARPVRRSYPLPAAKRRALPDRPGIYRLARSNADVLYVGKAASIRKRIAGHFSSGRRPNERALEMLTQVHAVDFVETESVLEAALLESDEIKRLDPAYNVQLRNAERNAWFASRDLREQVPTPDPAHRVGPLPSRRALAPFAALIELAGGAQPNPSLCATALAVPRQIGPDEALFSEGWRTFAVEHLQHEPVSPARRVEQAAHALWLVRGRDEASVSHEAAPDFWDLARVLRRLERSLVQGGLIKRRARWLCLLADADIAFREAAMPQARRLVLSRAHVVERGPLERVADLASRERRGWLPQHERQACFDAASYDRLRVLTTELHRVLEEGGEVGLRFATKLWLGERLARLMRAL